MLQRYSYDSGAPDFFPAFVFALTEFTYAITRCVQSALRHKLQVPTRDANSDPDKESLDILALIEAEARRIRLQEREQQLEREQNFMERLLQDQQDN